MQSCVRLENWSLNVSSLYTLTVYTLKFHWVDHLVKDTRRSTHISFLIAGGYEQFKIDIRRAYCAPCTSRATIMQKTMMLIESQRKGE